MELESIRWDLLKGGGELIHKQLQSLNGPPESWDWPELSINFASVGEAAVAATPFALQALAALPEESMHELVNCQRLMGIALVIIDEYRSGFKDSSAEMENTFRNSVDEFFIPLAGRYMTQTKCERIVDMWWLKTLFAAIAYGKGKPTLGQAVDDLPSARIDGELHELWVDDPD